MNRREILTYLERKQKEYTGVEGKTDCQKRYFVGYATALLEAKNLVKGMTLPAAIQTWLEKSGYPIVDMDRAVGSVEDVILSRLEDIIDLMWDDVDTNPEFLRSCNFNR